LSKRKVKRKSFAAREDLLEEMNVIAKENELSLYRFVNEVFELNLKVNELGISLRELIFSRRLLNDARENGFTLGLESLWYEMAELAYNNSKKKALESWNHAGVWLAKRYATAEIENPFEKFKTDLQDFTWNVPELDLTQQGERLIVRLVSPRFTESYTELFSAFLEGAVKTFGYEIDAKEVSRGIIRLEATKSIH
jgi:hypothetical protein